MTKQEIIEKVRGAADRVLKSSEDAMALAAALDAMGVEVAAAKSAIANGVVDYDKLYEECRDVYMILMSIQQGYPMVPAGGERADTAKRMAALVKSFPGAKDKAMTPAELVEWAVSELEAVSKLKKREEIAPRAFCVKAAMLAWESMPEGDLPVTVTYVDLSSSNGDNKVTSEEVTPAGLPAPAGTYGFAKAAVERAEKVAPPPAAAPAAKVNKAAEFKWSRDLAAEKA